MAATQRTTIALTFYGPVIVFKMRAMKAKQLKVYHTAYILLKNTLWYFQQIKIIISYSKKQKQNQKPHLQYSLEKFYFIFITNSSSLTTQGHNIVFS